MQRSSSKWILLDAHLGPSTPEGGGHRMAYIPQGRFCEGLAGSRYAMDRSYAASTPGFLGRLGRTARSSHRTCFAWSTRCQRPHWPEPRGFFELSARKPCPNESQSPPTEGP